MVLEEIKSTKDTPEEHIFDIFHEKLFPDDPLGRPILGTEEIVSGFERNSIVDFWRKQYSPENMVVSAAGNLDHDKLVRLVDKYFHFDTISGQTQPQMVEKITQSQEFIIPQPINQAHICTGGRGIPYNSEDRFALLVLNAYLGGGMSSRLFQRLREKRGLAYSIYSFIDFYSNIGLFGIYMGTDSSKLKTAQSLLQDELNKVVRKEISAGQLNRIKNQLKGNLVLGLESTSRRMTRLAKNELYFNEYVSIDSLIKNIDSVATNDIIRLANDIIHPDNFITVILQPAA